MIPGISEDVIRREPEHTRCRTRRSDEAVLRRGRSGLPGFGRPLLWSEKSLFCFICP